MAEQKVRWGVLSTSNIGRRAVLPAIQRSSNGELVAVASRDADKARTFADEQFVEDNQVRLGEVPIWLFSSGPLGQENPQPTGDPKQIDTLMADTRAREHRVFVGKLDKHSLGVGERLIARAVGAPEGDFRDWAAIRSWAHKITGVLKTNPTFGA